MRLKFVFRIFLFISLLFGGKYGLAQNDMSYGKAMQSANEYFAKQDYQNAKSYYQIALKQKPGDEIAKVKIRESLDLLRKAMKVKYAYQDEVEIADALFDKGDYDAAVAAYKGASIILPKETYPNDRIKESLKLKEETAEKRKEFNSLLSLADQALDENNYVQRLDLLNKALILFPNQADIKQSIQKTKELQTKYIADQAKYNEFIRKGSYLFDRKKFKEAQIEFKEAANIFPNAKLAQEMLQQLPALIQSQGRYELIVTTADSLYVQKQFRKAKAMYQEALIADPNENFPLSMISKIDEELANKASSVESDYKEAIAKGDELFISQKWNEARTEFALAKSLKPEASYPPQKLGEIEKQLLAMERDASLEKALAAYLSKADEAYAKQDYLIAKTNYEEVLSLDPNNTLAQSKVTELTSMLEQMVANKEKKAEFDQLLQEADTFFGNKNYKQALVKYESSTQLFPENTFVQDRITEIKEKQANLLKAEELELLFTENMTQGDALFAENNLETARQSYQKALDLKPNAVKPQSQISLIDDKLNRLAQQRSQEENFEAAMTQADQFLVQKDLIAAKEQYQKALDIFPSKTDVADKIAIIDGQLKSIADKKVLDETYAIALNNAQASFDSQDFIQAQSNWQRASELKPQEALPKTKLAEVKLKLDGIAKNKALQQEFDVLIKAADLLYAENNLDGALSKYQEADQLIPGKVNMQEKILGVQSAIKEKAIKDNLEAEFKQAIASADRLFEEKSYVSAIAEYEKAKTIKADDLYPRSQINKINGILQEIERQKQIDTNYQLAITQADQALQKENWGEAKSNYLDAAKLKSDEAYPAKQIVYIDQMLIEKQAEINAQYQAAISKGDQELAVKNYQEALNNFKIAASLKSDEVYPRQKQTEVEEILQAQMKALMTEYNQAIGVADNYYNTKAYDRAIQKYTEAQKVKVDETYPKEMINKITKYLEENAIVSLNEGGEELASRVTKKFDFTPIPTNLRKSNFLLVRASNPGSAEVKVQISYGKGSAKNGGAVISIEPGTETKDYLIRIGSQYKWFSQDNDWLSFYPQNGKIDLKLIQISKGE